MTAALGATLTTAMRMVNRVHGGATNERPPAEPASTPRLAEALVLVLEVADLTDGHAALGQHLTELAAGQTKKNILAFLRHDLRVAARAATHLAATTYLQLHIVDEGTERNRGEPQGVARLDVRRVGGHHRVAHVEAEGARM